MAWLSFPGALPLIQSSPAVGTSRPLASLIKVVFPLPLGPSRPTIRPGSMVKLIPSRAVTAPKRLLSPLHSRMLMVSLLSFRLYKCDDLSQLEPQLVHSL